MLSEKHFQKASENYNKKISHLTMTPTPAMFLIQIFRLTNTYPRHTHTHNFNSFSLSEENTHEWSVISTFSPQNELLFKQHEENDKKNDSVQVTT
jgi:hypothetical protein